MEEKIIIAGSGGQGVLTLGLFLSNVAVSVGKNVTWLPSYGAEKRGGFSFCNVIISDDEIFSPVVDKPTTLIVFDQRAYENYKNKIEPFTVFIENSSLVKSGEIKGRKISIPASNIAKDMNFIRGTNMVIAGAYSAVVEIFEKDKYLKVMEEMLKGRKNEVIEKNFYIFNQGIKFIKESGVLGNSRCGINMGKGEYNKWGKSDQQE